MNFQPASTFLTVKSQYLPPVSEFVIMQSHSTIVIDGEEKFQKSAWQNRCLIVNANGPLLLSIPISGGRGVKSKTKDVRIDNGEHWQQKHWRSLRAAYGKSPYFFFLEEKFRDQFEKRFEFLIDFNTQLLTVCFEILQWRKKIFLHEQSADVLHAAPLLNAKRETQNFKSYHQVFEDKHGFVGNASIVDLLANLGNESVVYLGNLENE